MGFSDNSRGWLVPVILIASLQAVPALELVPMERTRNFEGCSLRQWEFPDGERWVTYEPPSGWTCSGTGSSEQLVLIPSGSRNGSAVMRRQTTDVPTQLTPESMQALKELALASLPEGAREAVIEGEEANPLRLGGCETFEVKIAFDEAGKHRRKSILFALAQNELLWFEVTASAKDFNGLFREFRASLYSWCWSSFEVSSG